MRSPPSFPSERDSPPSSLDLASPDVGDIPARPPSPRIFRFDVQWCGVAPVVALIVLLVTACVAALVLSPAVAARVRASLPPSFSTDELAAADSATSAAAAAAQHHTGAPRLGPHAREREWLRKEAEWHGERERLLRECASKTPPPPPQQGPDLAHSLKPLDPCEVCNAARIKADEVKRLRRRNNATAFASSPARGHPITPVVAERHRQHFEASLAREHAAQTVPPAADTPAEDAPLASVTCTWQFSHYTSSAWETEWYNQVDALQSGPQPLEGAICSKLIQGPDLERGTYLVTRVVELSRGANRPESSRINATRGPPYTSLVPNPHDDQSMADFLNIDLKRTTSKRRGRRLLADDTSETTTTTTTTSSTPAPNSTGEPRLRIGTREHMRDVADQLFSRMHYKLVCTPGGVRDSIDGTDAAPRDSFVAARGFDFIEPLIGLLRDPLTICPWPAYNDPVVPTHIRGYYRSSEHEGQSKNFLLTQIATPFHVEVRKEEATSGGVDQVSKGPDEDGVLPPWVTPAVLRRVNVAIDTIATGSGAAPWMHRESHIPFDAPSNAPADAPYEFLSSGLQPSYSARLVVPESEVSPQAAVKQLLDPTSVDGSTDSLPVGTLLVSERSDEEEQTAIVIDADGEVSLPGALSIAAPFWNPTNSRRHPASGAPRIILFDLGASYFSGWDDDVAALGSAWFYQQLALRGQRIDQLYAWEYEILDPVVEWKQIPLQLYPHMSFINTGVSADPRQTDNPWNTLLSVARPIDYVIIKLDIDSDWIETPLMEQLLATPKLQRLVDEMFFEHHVALHEMYPAWRATTGSITLSYQWYTTLRQAGIRMHSWP